MVGVGAGVRGVCYTKIAKYLRSCSSFHFVSVGRFWFFFFFALNSFCRSQETLIDVGRQNDKQLPACGEVYVRKKSLEIRAVHNFAQK